MINACFAHIAIDLREEGSFQGEELVSILGLKSWRVGLELEKQSAVQDEDAGCELGLEAVFDERIFCPRRD